MEKIIQESVFDKKKKKPGLKFNPGLALAGVRTTAAVLLFLVQWYDRQTSWHVKKKQQQQLYIKARDKTNLHTAENGSPTHTQTKMPWFSEAIFELRSNA